MAYNHPNRTAVSNYQQIALPLPFNNRIQRAQNSPAKIANGLAFGKGKFVRPVKPLPQPLAVTGLYLLEGQPLPQAKVDLA